MKTSFNFHLVSAVWLRPVTILAVLFLSALALLPTFSFSSAQSTKNSATISEESKTNLNEAYGRLPLSFIPNEGQLDRQVKFVSRGSGFNLFLTAQEAVLDLKKSEDIGYSGQNIVDKLNSTPLESPALAAESSKTIRLQLLGANPQPVIQALQEQPGQTNYFLGDDSSKWRTNIKNYGQVRYQSQYQGIDLLYYGTQQHLEYDFEVAPGANPADIQFNFKGVDSLSLNGQGELVLQLSGSRLVQRSPVIYQEVNRTRRIIQGGYLLKPDPAGTNQPVVGFEIQDYDRSLPLVIDPILDYSSYLGGNGNDAAFGVAVNSSGEAFISGTTTSTDFPTLGVAGSTHRGSDIFVEKLNATGTAVSYSAFLGGSGEDHGQRLAVDSGGNAYLTGDTNSTNFPLAAATQATYGGGTTDAFITKLNPAGNALVYSTYLGGSLTDEGNQVGVDSLGNAYVTGFTQSTGLSTTGAYQTSLKGTWDAYVVKLNASGAKEYLTYLGGSSDDYGFSLAVGGPDDVYVTGATTSSDFPRVGPSQAFGGLTDAFVTRLATVASSALTYSVLVGGSAGDFGYGIAVDSSGSAYITGNTNSLNFPTSNALQASSGGGFDAIAVKLNSSGGLAYSTYLGGANYEQGNGIGVDNTGKVYITGQTFSNNFPDLNAVRLALRGSSDGFVTEINAAGNGLVYSTFLGGSNADAGNYLAVDSSGNAYVVGSTGSNNFPTQNPVQPAFAGGPLDAFVTKISPALNPLVVTATDDFGAASAATPGTLSYALANAAPYQTISFQLTSGNTITIHNPLAAPANSNINIDGGRCNTSGIVLDGNGLTADGLTLSKGVTVRNLTVKDFNGRRIVANATGGLGNNLLLCVKAIR